MNDNPESPTAKTRASRYRLFSSIRGRLFLLLLLVLIPVMLVQGVYIYVRFKELMEGATHEDVEMSRAVAAAYSGFIEGLLHQEKAIGANFTISLPVSAEEMEKILKVNKTEFPAVRNFEWLDPHGRVIMSSVRSAIGLDLSDRDYVRRLLAGGKWVVSDLERSKDTGRPNFTVSLAVRGKKGSLQGIVAATIDPEKLENLIPIHPADEAVTIIDRHGAAVYRVPGGKWMWEGRSRLKDLPAVRQVLKGRGVSGVIRTNGRRKDRIAAFAPIVPSGWVACASRSRKGVMAPIESQLFREGFVFLLVSGLAFLGAFMLSEVISGSIRRLLVHASVLGGGDVESAIEVRGPAELKGLASALNATAEKVRTRESALKAAQQRLISVLEAMPACVFLQAPDRSIVFANRTFRETFGDPEGVTCHELFMGMAEPCERCDIPGVLNSHIPPCWEWTAPDGKRYSIHTHPLTDADGAPLVLKLAVDITYLRQTQLALEQSEGRLRFLSAQLLSAHEEERKRIARELHDSVGSSLAVIKMGLENTRVELERRQYGAEMLDPAIEWTQLTIDEVRRLVTDLRPPLLDDMGVLAALRWFFRQYRTIYPAIHVEAEIGIEEQDIPEPLRIVIFRITQEAFHNIGKHSKAEYVDFSLARREEAIRLSVEDNGEGFDMEAVRDPQGVGLASMKERAELSGGSFSIRSVPGTGTILSAEWPASTCAGSN